MPGFKLKFVFQLGPLHQGAFDKQLEVALEAVAAGRLFVWYITEWYYKWRQNTQIRIVSHVHADGKGGGGDVPDINHADNHISCSHLNADSSQWSGTVNRLLEAVLVMAIDGRVSSTSSSNPSTSSTTAGTYSFATLHIRRGDTKSFCNTNPVRVIEFMRCETAFNTAQVQVPERFGHYEVVAENATINSASTSTLDGVVLLWFTDETKTVYIQEVQAALATHFVTPHGPFKEVVFAEPIIHGGKGRVKLI
jgi:hypothetical protein